MSELARAMLDVDSIALGIPLETEHMQQTNITTTRLANAIDNRAMELCYLSLAECH